MGIEFVLGRTAAKREEYLLKCIGELTQADPLALVLVIVPPQATYATECMILDRLGISGMMGIGVASISRVCDRVLEGTYGAAQKTLDEAGKSMLIGQIMDENTGRLRVLNKLRSHFLLPPQMAEVITELKQLDITPELLRDFPVENPATKAKFEDVAFVFEQLEERACDLYDKEDRLELVAEHVHRAEFIRDAHVFIHGFDMYNAQTVRFITEIMKTARHTTISFLYAEANEPDSSVYGICDENRMRFYAEAEKLGLTVKVIMQEEEKSPDILHIEKNLFAYPVKKAGYAQDVSISTAADVDGEVRGVCAQIAYLVHKKGLCFRDMAVVCGDGEAYLPVLRKRMKQTDIPCFTGEKRPLAKSNLTKFVLTAVELAKGRIGKDVLLAHAASGFCNVTGMQCGALQNYAYERIRDGFAFLLEWDGEQETARKALMEPLVRLRDCARRAVQADALIDCVLEYMKELGVLEKTEQTVARMRENGLFEDADYAEQAYKKLTSVLEQARDNLHGVKIGASRLMRILEAGVAAEEIGVIPPAVDEVLCGDIAGTYLPQIKVLFVVGTNEGTLPNYARVTDILTEDEREMILGGLKGLAHTGRMEKQKLAIVKAFAKPTEKLYISYVEDGVLRPSLLIDRLRGLFAGIRTNSMADIAPMLKANAFCLTAERICAAADGAGDADGMDSVVSAVLRDPDYDGRMAVLERGIAQKNSAARIVNAQNLYGKIVPSATRIESFYACPYRHFMRYGVRAQVPQEYTIDRLDIGRYTHGMLDGMAKELAQRGLDWDAPNRQEFEEIALQCAQRTAEQQSKYTLNMHNKTVLRAVTRDVMLVADMIREQSRMGVLKPYKTEESFNLTENGVYGVIDRIDTAEIAGRKYFGIVDYKTGKNDFALGRFVAGLDLQLIVYIMAAQELLGSEYAFAGANYMRVFGALKEREQALAPLYRMRGLEGAAADIARELYGEGESRYLFSVNMRVKSDGAYYAYSQERCFGRDELQAVLNHGRRMIRDAVERIGIGENEIVPAGDGKEGLVCRYCDYRSICMFDEVRDAQNVRRIEKLGKEDAMRVICEVGVQ